VGLIERIHVKSEYGELVKYSRCKHVIVAGINEFVNQWGVTMDVPPGVWGNGGRKAEGCLSADIEEACSVIGEIKLVILIVSHSVNLVSK
jgi:hypothetical protein